MKKFLAMLLALVMVLGLAACGGNGGTSNESPNPDSSDNSNQGGENTTVTNPDEIADEMTSEDGKYQVAFITDVGQLKDKSFNQGTFDGVKLYAYNNGLSYKYYQPANGDEATDDDRYEAMKAAVDNGAEIVVCAGFMQAAALTQAASEFTDTKFVFIDGWTLTDANNNALTNVAAIAFQEEQSGYLAGYAAVKDGYTKLGFSGGGGGDNPACCRFGYGYVQGANAAAAEMGVQVEIKYSWEYGASFSASPELQTMISGWYENGTEVVFACGGSMFSSIAAAAGANDCAVIGVDVDQSYESEYVITSAMKGLSDAVQWTVGKFYGESWAEVGGNTTSLGAKDNAVGLPTATWSLEGFTVEEYEALYAKLVSGELVVDADYSNLEQTYSNVTVNVI